jgi:hypothetical protein
LNFGIELGFRLFWHFASFSFVQFLQIILVISLVIVSRKIFKWQTPSCGLEFLNISIVSPLKSSIYSNLTPLLHGMLWKPLRQYADELISQSLNCWRLLLGCRISFHVRYSIVVFQLANWNKQTKHTNPFG